MTIPEGASGILMQGTGFWSFDGEMTGDNEGFKLNDTIPEIVWFNNQVKGIYFRGLVRFQFLSPVGY